MHTVSQEAYRFLVEAYEEAVEAFYDDPTGYADGEPLKRVFSELKKLGEELEVDPISLATDDDLERLAEFMNQEEGVIIDVDEYPGLIDDLWYESYCHKDQQPQGHMAMGAPIGPGSSYRHVTINNEEENKSVEEKLKALSKSRQSDDDEMIGEWTTYDMEEE